MSMSALAIYGFRLVAADCDHTEIRLLMHPFEQSGVTGVVAHRVEERILADEGHVEAMVVECVLERVEDPFEFGQPRLSMPIS